MLAFDPNQRQSLAEIVETDEWVNIKDQMEIAAYFKTMDYIHSKIAQ